MGCEFEVQRYRGNGSGGFNRDGENSASSALVHSTNQNSEADVCVDVCQGKREGI